MRTLSAFLLLALAMPAAAQRSQILNADLPPELEVRLLGLYDGEARRVQGDARIGASELVSGDIAASAGLLRIAGRVEGDVAMVGGDVIVESGGRVTGAVTVVAGEVRLEQNGLVGGTISSYGPTARAADDDWNDWDDWRDRRRSRWLEHGFSRLTVRAGSSYNRVEGLPLMFGPVIQTRGANPLRLEALAIWRTESGSLDTDRMGYQASLEQFLGGRRAFSVGASVYSVVEPMDRWHVSDLETSLAAALFREDYRDHHDRTGWSAFARVQPTRALEGRVEYRAEEHTSVAAADSWSLFDGDDPWRLQPLVAHGDVQTIRGSLTLDLRDRKDDPEHGWYGRVALERPVGGALTRPALEGVTWQEGPRLPDDGAIPAAIAARPMDLDFTTGIIDIRRYDPVGYRSQLNLRFVAAGSLSDRGLPPQYQHALGGPGTLPGFDPFLVDCGARSLVGSYQDERFFPAYGCDRIVMGQVEYRGSLSLDLGFGEPDYDHDDRWHDIHVDMDPSWVVFLDAGQGWGFGDLAGDRGRNTGMLYDVGVGFLIDELGIYAALPLNGEVEQEPRFFIRLGRRF